MSKILSHFHCDNNMILMSILAPFNNTPLITEVFGSHRLRTIKESFKLELESNMAKLIDSAVLSAIRLKLNSKDEKAMDALSVITDRRLRNMFEQLIINLPRKEDSPDAEETLATNFISPILRAFLQNIEDGIITRFPNTDSKAQKRQRVLSDCQCFSNIRFAFSNICKNISIFAFAFAFEKLEGIELSFGEVTGYHQESDKSKNGFDLWRLARYGKCVLDQGTPMVPLVQIIYDKGTVYRPVVRARGVMVLAEVGIFTIPMYLNDIATLQASLSTLEWYKLTVHWLNDEREENKDRRLSWRTGDLANIKKFLC